MKMRFLVVMLLLWVLPALAQPIVLSCVTLAPTRTPTATPTPTLTRTVTPTTGVGGAVLKSFVQGVGSARDVTIIGNTAWVASAEFGLSGINITTPASPSIIGAANPPFYGDRVAVSGTLAVVTGASLGLTVVDISTPSAPHPVGTLGGSMASVVMSGQFAYVLLGVAGNPPHTDLAVIDLAVPSAPTIRGRVTLTGGLDIRLNGTLAYIACGNGGMQIVNVANPDNPVILSTMLVPTTAYGMAVAGSFAYIAGNTAVYVVNVTTPSAPFIAGSLGSMTFATAIAAVGTTAYVIDLANFKVVNASNPAAPTLSSTSDARNAQHLTAAGTNTYLTSPTVNPGLGTAGLYVWNVANPASPARIANVWDGFDNFGVGTSGTLAVVGGGSLGMRVLNITNPVLPQVVGTQVGSINGVTMSGSFAYALLGVPGNPPHTDLAVVNLTVPSSPTISGQVTLVGGADVAVAGTLAYTAGASSMQIVNVVTPSSPAILSTLALGATAYGIAVQGAVAYVANNTLFRVVNISNPNAPSVITALPMTFVTAITVSGPRAYVLDNFKLTVIDIANPAAPVVLSSGGTYGSPQKLATRGNTVYLVSPANSHTDTAGGVYVVDVTNGAAPVLVKQIIVPGLTRSVTSGSTYVLTGDTTATLDIIQP